MKKDADVTAAAAAVGSDPKSDVKSSTTSVDPSSVTSPTETVTSDSTSDVKTSPTGGVSGGAYYDGPGETVIRMSSEFYSKLLLWSYYTIRRWCDEFIDSSADNHGGTPSTSRKGEVVVALSFVTGKNSIFWMNEKYPDEISDHIVKYFQSLVETLDVKS